jgi:hypothetical protein
MPNYPVKPRAQDKRRPPRFERVHDLSAFLLGYEPYHLVAELFYFKDSLEPETERWLRDLPVHLGPFLGEYTIERFGATIGEVLAQFEAHPNAQLSSSSSEAIGTADDAPEAVIADARPLMDRDTFSFIDSLYGGDQPSHALIGLAQSASVHFPDPMRQWFRFGQGVGQCLLRVVARPYRPYEDTAIDLEEGVQLSSTDAIGNPEEYVEEECEIPEIESGLKIEVDAGSTDGGPEDEHEIPEIDLRKEIQLAANGTDWLPEDVPDVSLETYPHPGLPSYGQWVYNTVEKLVSEVRRFLEDDAPIVLSKTGLYLWFLGTPVNLTSSECAFLAAAAECVEETITRKYLLRTGMNVPSNSDSGLDLHKADQWLQQIVGKIIESLHKVRSPYCKETVEDTRKWLREVFFVRVSGAGWRKGPLMKRMAVKRAP